jgi:hypothetical protein
MSQYVRLYIQYTYKLYPIRRNLMSPRSHNQEDFTEGKEVSHDGGFQKELKKRGKERVQFDFSPDALDRIDRLKELIGASTRAEVIRQSLRVLDWFVTEIDSEDMVTVTDKDDEIITTFRAKLLITKSSS